MDEQLPWRIRRLSDDVIVGRALTEELALAFQGSLDGDYEVEESDD